MPKKCKTPKNGECGENQELGSGYMLGNKEEEISAFRCPSPKSPTVAGEMQAIVAGTGSNSWAAAAQCCKSGQGRVNTVAMCGTTAGAEFRDLSGFLLLRLISEALCYGRIQKSKESPLPACQGDVLSQQSLAVPLACPPGRILQTCRRSRTRTQTRFSLMAVPVCP